MSRVPNALWDEFFVWGIKSFREYWAAHFGRDHKNGNFSDSAYYTDVKLESCAIGPEEIILRLRLGLSHWRDTSISQEYDL